MTRKRSVPIFRKVSNLLKLSIFLAKMKKPIISKLIYLKRFKLVQHYNYGYIQEYQYSPSTTPLISYNRMSLKKRSSRVLSSIFVKCECLGWFRDDEGRYRDYSLEALHSIEDPMAIELSDLYHSDGEEDSVDERAERFIEKFYEEMRKQRQESLLQLVKC